MVAAAALTPAGVPAQRQKYTEPPRRSTGFFGPSLPAGFERPGDLWAGAKLPRPSGHARRFRVLHLSNKSKRLFPEGAKGQAP